MEPSGTDGKTKGERERERERRTRGKTSRGLFALLAARSAIALLSVRTRVHHVICLESACLVCYSLFMRSTSSEGNENKDEGDDRRCALGEEPESLSEVSKSPRHDYKAMPVTSPDLLVRPVIVRREPHRSRRLARLFSSD